MWNNEESLISIFTQLSMKNLGFIQKFIDDDKYYNSLENDYDMCGQYAPFCQYCDKTEKTPCAKACVKFMQAHGIAVSETETTVDFAEITEVKGTQPIEEVAKNKEPEVISEWAESEIAIAEDNCREDNSIECIGTKNYVRLAVAKKKN